MLAIWDLRSGSLVNTFSIVPFIGEQYFHGFAHSSVPVIDMTGLEIPSTFILSPDRRDLWVTVQRDPMYSGGGRPDIFLARFTLSPDTGTPPIERLEFTPNQESVRDVAIAPDGRFAASVAGQTLITWSLPDGTYDQVWRTHYPNVAYMAIGPDFRRETLGFPARLQWRSED